MKVAVLAESPADEAALRILVDGLLGAPSEVPSSEFPIRERGWPAVKSVLKPVAQHFHYRTDAEALVVVVDRNGSPNHIPAHDAGRANDCRICQLRDVFDRANLRPNPPKAMLRLALGLPAPAIEAWLRSGVDANVSEATWENALRARRPPPYSKSSLKFDVYGTDHPVQGLAPARMAEECRRIVAAPGGLAALEQSFPDGFGLLAHEIRSWRNG